MNMTDKIKSWKVARFPPEVKQEIFERDGYKCILCWSTQMLNAHHSLYSTQSIYDETRNTKLNWVTLCQEPCHEEVHGCRKWIGKRQECIDYLDRLYEANN